MVLDPTRREFESHKEHLDARKKNVHVMKCALTEFHLMKTYYHKPQGFGMKV